MTTLVYSHFTLAYGPFKTPATSSIKPGDSIVLNKPVSTPYGAKIYVQGGKSITYKEVRWAQPYCYFHLYRSPSIVNTEASLLSGDFTIRSTVNYYDLVSVEQPLLQYAGRFITQDASEKTILTKFKLHSPSQPEVIGLNCGIWAVANERNHLSLDEIEGALGELVTLKTAS